jgi:hypothetical protein
MKKWVSLAMLVAAPLVYLVAVFGTRQMFLEGYYWTRWLDPAALLRPYRPIITPSPIADLPL